MGTQGQKGTNGGGQGVGQMGSGAVFRTEGTYTQNRHHPLPTEKNTQALSFGASNLVYSNPGVPGTSLETGMEPVGGCHTCMGGKSLSYSPLNAEFYRT